MAVWRQKSIFRLGLESSIWVKGWLVAAAVGPKVLGRAGRLQFVRVVCSVWAGAQP